MNLERVQVERERRWEGGRGGGRERREGGRTAGEFLYPFQNENTPPPRHPMANAAPQSSMIRHGLGVCVFVAW